MQPGVLQALNPLSNPATLIAIVPGAYPGEAKCGKCAIKRSFTSRLAADISLYLRNG